MAKAILKGSTISTWRPILVVPLFDDEDFRDITDLPLLNPEGLLCDSLNISLSLSNGARHKLFTKTLRSSPLDIEKAAIIVASVLSLKGNLFLIDQCFQHCSPNQNEQFDDFQREDLILEAYQSVQDNPKNLVRSLNDWTRLVRSLVKGLHFAVEDHPLLEYAKSVIPKLSPDQLEVVRKTLQLKKMTSSSLAVQKLARDRAESDPLRLFAVLLNNEQDPLSNSCLPTAQLQLLRSNDGLIVQLSSLYDGDGSSTPSVELYPSASSDDIGFRDTCMQQRFQRSCACLRCRYELFPLSGTLEGSTANEILKLARYMLGHGKIAEAETLYEHIQQREELDLSVHADVSHALGAIALQNGQFLKAQRIWKSAENRDHPGLALQHDKLVAYKYFDQNFDAIHATPTNFIESPVKGVHVTSVVSSDVCRNLIDWAEASNQWTRSRHYAVPTFDTPVHALGGPFLSWFNSFMHSTMQRILSNRFGPGQYYIHDAFCVRYDATATSNYLPVHTDESTHSFVLALNQGQGKDYAGGGTYFFEADKTIHLETGSVLCFRGDDVLHGGEPVTRGSRYIVAAFLYKEVVNGQKSLRGISTAFESKQEPFSFAFLDV